MILQADGLDQASCDTMTKERSLAEKVVHFLANFGAPYGAQNLWTPILFAIGTGFCLTGLTLANEGFELLKWFLPSFAGITIIIQSIILRKVIYLGEKYGEEEALIYRGVIGAVVISTWISIMKTIIEFYLNFGGVAN